MVRKWLGQKGIWRFYRDEWLNWKTLHPKKRRLSGNTVAVFTHLKDCLKTFHSEHEFLSICYVPGSMPEAKDTEDENQNWSLIFWRFMTSGRSLSVAPESRTVANGRQVEEQGHHTRQLCWTEGSSFVKEWTEQRGQAPQGWAGWVWEGTTTSQGVAQGTMRPMLILQGCKISGANIIIQKQDLFRITLHSI